jgi:hypothetical protein
VDDYVKTALFAKECGAQIVEANFSCPNVCSGGLYLMLADVLRTSVSCLCVLVCCCEYACVCVYVCVVVVVVVVV